MEIFDVIEYCHFHTPGLNLNTSALRLARKYGKPVVATSDAHRLDFFGDHYSFVQAERTIEAVFESIRAGKVRLVSPAWPLHRFLRYLFYLSVTHPALRFFTRLS
jgi:hypothetical protein